MAVTIGGSGQVPVQIQSTWLGTVFTSTTGSYVNVTGLSLSITPTSASNKVLIMATIDMGSNSDSLVQITRNGTVVGTGSGGSVQNGFGQNSGSYQDAIWTQALTYLDSPATTSAITYQIQVYTSGTVYINRRGTNGSFGGSSSITAVEIAYA